MNILVAEDDSVSRRILHRNLTRLGHTVSEAGNGVEAWSILQHDQIRMAISEAGILLCLTKPVKQSKLYDALATVMANSNTDVPDTFAANASSSSPSMTPSTSRGNARI